MAAEKIKTPLTCPKMALYLETESAHPGGRGTYYARVPADHGIDDVTNPVYFGLAQGEKKIQVGDRITVEPESGAWEVELRVMACLPNIGQVITRQRDFQDYTVKAPAGYKFAWEGDQKRWTIYKGAVAVDAGFYSQEECLARVDELVRDKAA